MTLRIPVRWWPGERVEVRLRIVLSLVPAWLFLFMSRIAPPWVSIPVGFGASLLIYVGTGHSRLVGAMATFALAVVGVHAVFGVIFDDEKAYLGAGWVTDLLFVPVYLVSALIGKPLVGGVAREMVPTIAGRLPIGAPVYRRLSFFWAAFYAGHGVVQAVLWQRLSVAEFIIWSRVVLWPPTGVALLVSAAFIWLGARRMQQSPPQTTSAREPGSA